ncbi:hypothetical protein SARC_04334 [Sphaeroforma arctica JP610]|uniref:Uncharacterized protein n=1 Tax=Sphaeroforma arctica JP610 TaxID=667725 RepID=A0A0L0G2Q4_9EUKA|nr:hypothetical protein SARC_04334 [Sphaeroforma arctica JP610]KNC83417.1 hypothetical protein SARC_04334 [Sphaeroforma arctica JP610]|eukprot:XP_014157319.1 hypothetical protein SARC_04334 [Sphaeroforma arctica JP610]
MALEVSNLKNESSSSEDSEGYFVEEDKWYETVTDPPPKQPKEMRLSELYIEKVLDSKKNEDTSKSSVFQLKFHGLSYHNLRWVTQEDLIKNFKSGKQRVRNFLEKDSGSTFYEPGQAFNPAYLHVDRVIQHHRPKGLSGKIWYLVKWNGLDYEKATWESSTDLQDADSQQAVKLYRKRNIVSRVKVQDPLAYRSKSPVYQVIEESPKDFPEPYKLLDYQLEGLNWMVWQWHQNRNCILADEMGLGKTVQSVAFIHHLHVTLKLAGPFLVVAPLSTIGHWLREFETWTDLNVVLIKGSSTNRRVIKETELFHRRDGKVDKKQYKFDVILTTYEYALQESTLLKAIRFTTCILDEAHRLKNVDCKLQNQLREYKFMHQVLLTGTPLQNSVNEIWALLNYMDEPRFPDLEDFLDDFGDVKSDTDVKKLQDVLHKYMLRREKRDVKKEIPQKKETIVQVELTSIQKRYYRAILERNLKVLAQGTSLPNLNNISMELRKCCIHPYLITGCEDSVVLEEKCDTPEKRDQALIHASGKMVLVDKLLKKLKAGGHKVLIFSQMTKCLDILQDYLEAANYNFERLDGNTGGEARQQAIDRYSRKDSDGFVFLLSTKAGGVGINLTAADTVIIYDSDWNPQNDVQAQARVHRIGQKSKVEIYRLITHNTYEEEMFKKASMKLGLEQAVMGNMSKDSKPGLSNKKMIEELVKKGAYGTLMDENDTEGNKFSAETIDEILEKRATVVVMEDDTEQGASSFAKARFEVKDTISDLNVDDPEFWTKWAQRQNMDINKLMKESEDENIVYGARKRKKPTYYQMTHAPGSAKAKRGASRYARLLWMFD